MSMPLIKPFSLSTVAAFNLDLPVD